MNALSACVRIAAGQHGAIARPQALAAGLSADRIDRLTRSGAWVKRHPRVYALWEPEDRWLHGLMAGILWLGGGSAVSHRAGVVLHNLDWVDSAPLEFSTTGEHRLRGRRRRGQLVLHRVGCMPDMDLEVRKGIRVTSLTRTLIDLGSVAGPREVELALESALRRGLTSVATLRARLAGLPRHSPRRGDCLWDLLDELPSVATESAAETLFWRLLLDADVDPPMRQHEIFASDGTFAARVDFAYVAEKVAIEVDGYAFHSSREHWQRDRRRQNALAAMGWTVYRVTWADLTRRGSIVVREIVRLLASRPVLLGSVGVVGR